jgi:CHRD domain
MKTLVFLLYVTSILMFCGLFYSNKSVSAENVDRFWCVLDGNQQMPPNITSAHGFIGLKFTEDSSKLVFNINVNDIDNITGIYIYSGGSNNQNGSLILDLLEEAKELKNDDINIMKVNRDDIEGTVAVGGITSDDLQGELKGKTLEDLRNLMMDGAVYVDVQTKEFPHGEIKGDEFIPIDRIFPDISDFDWS